jgi:hypothetical protein
LEGDGQRRVATKGAVSAQESRGRSMEKKRQDLEIRNKLERERKEKEK